MKYNIPMPKAPYSTIYHEKVRSRGGSVFFDSEFPLLFLAAQKQKKSIVVGEKNPEGKVPEKIPLHVSLDV